MQPSPPFELHDGELQTEDGAVFPICKFELARISEYFWDLFTGVVGRRERRFLITDINGEILGTVLSIIKTKDLSGVTDSNVGQLLSAAHKLGLDDLMVDTVSGLIEQNPLTVTNSLPFFLAALKVDRGGVVRECLRFIVTRFSSVAEVHGSALSLLPQSSLEQLLSNSSLNVRTEAQVWEVVRIWIEADVKNRQHLLPRLLKHLAVLDVTEVLADHILGSTIVVNNPHCKPLLLMKKSDQCRTSIDVIKNFASQDQDQDVAMMFSSRVATQVYIIAHRSLSCQEQDIKTNLYVTYDGNLDLWRDFRPIIKQSDGTQQYMIIGNDIFALSNYQQPIRYNLIQKEQTELESFVRTDVVYVQLGDFIYGIGGFYDDGLLDSDEFFSRVSEPSVDFEKYAPEEDHWYDMAPMLEPLLDDTIQAAVVAGRIYVIGRSPIKADGSYHTVALVYSPDTNSWAHFPAPPVPGHRPRLGEFTVKEYRGRLFLFEGRNDRCRGNRMVLKFSPELQLWFAHEPLPLEYHKPTALVLKGELIVHEDILTIVDFGENGDAYHPPLRWDEGQKSWKQFHAKSPLNSIHEYQFISPNRKEVTEFLAKENKDLIDEFTKSNLAPEYDDEGFFRY